MRENVLETALGVCMAALLLSVGVFLTWRLRGVQLRRLVPAFRGIGKGERSGISAFSAACTNLGATVGMGNVLGVASGIAAGGPGCLLWMLVAAFFGMAVRWYENVLGARLRRQTPQGGYGGAFFYIERFLPRFGKAAAKLYAAVLVFGSVCGMGLMLQARCIRTVWAAETGETAFGVLRIAILLLLATAPVLLGGAKRIAKIAEKLVPLMTLGYLLCCCWILFRFRAELPRVVSEIFRSAFYVRSASGAALGVFLRSTFLGGVRRGLFSNEAGLGVGSIAAAAAEHTDPAQLGDVGIVVTFVDTFVICVLSGLCILVTNCAEDLPGMWRTGLPWMADAAPILLSAFLTTFALTSIYGAGFSAESALRYLGGAKYLSAYRLVSVFAVLLGVFLPQRIFWRSADALNAALAIPNLAALYFAAKHGEGVAPGI